MEKNYKEIDEHLLSKLSQNLKLKMENQIHFDILQKMNIIVDNFSKDFCEDILTSMNQIRLPPKEFIYEVNWNLLQESQNKEDPKLFFIDEGTAELILESKKNRNCFFILKLRNESISLTKIKEKETIGMRSFFSGIHSSESAITTSFCTIWYIKLSEFLKVLERHEKDKV